MAGVEVSAVSVVQVPEGAHVLDVREAHEWDAGHVEGAQHIPLGEVSARAAEVPAGAVYVICKVGGRSAMAAALLSRAGKQAVNVEGGMAAWAGAGKPMVSTSGNAPYVFGA